MCVAIFFSYIQVSIFVQLFFPDCSCLPLFAKPKRFANVCCCFVLTTFWAMHLLFFFHSFHSPSLYLVPFDSLPICLLVLKNIYAHTMMQLHYFWVCAWLCFPLSILFCLILFPCSLLFYSEHKGFWCWYCSPYLALFVAVFCKNKKVFNVGIVPTICSCSMCFLFSLYLSVCLSFPVVFIICVVAMS